MKKFIFLILILLISLPASSAGYPGIPSEIEETKLSDIAANPAAYDGQNVLLIGTIANICPTSGCHFVLQASGQVIYVYPSGFKLPKLKKGRPVKVYARIKMGKKRLVLLALGLEVN